MFKHTERKYRNLRHRSVCWCIQILREVCMHDRHCKIDSGNEVGDHEGAQPNLEYSSDEKGILARNLECKVGTELTMMYHFL